MTFLLAAPDTGLDELAQTGEFPEPITWRPRDMAHDTGSRSIVTKTGM
jgi:hypothetical protein